MNTEEIKFLRKPKQEINELFWQRYSPRALSGELIEEEDFMKIMEAARWAPSSYNEQPWRFVYAKRKTELFDQFFEFLFEGNKIWAQRSSHLLILTSKKTFTKNGKDNVVHAFDTGAAWENLALQASELGYVAHGIGGFDKERVRKELKIDPEYEVHAMIALGKHGDIKELPENLHEGEKPNTRKEIDEILSEGYFKW